MWLKIFTCVSFLVISVICEIEDQAPAQSLHYEYGRHYGYGHHHVPVHEVHVPYGYAVGPHGLVHKHGYHVGYNHHGYGYEHEYGHHHGAPIHHPLPHHAKGYVPVYGPGYHDHIAGYAHGHDAIGPFYHHTGAFGPFGFYANFYHD